MYIVIINAPGEATRVEFFAHSESADEYFQSASSRYLDTTGSEVLFLVGEITNRGMRSTRRIILEEG